ncbi:unnamed protein product [Arabidopsis thaliana]|uniref:TLC domain-containing protein n=1 Tax=Arabidopsis thaliana TaxID=3702 RepID=Q9LU96_ARATH|nr:unnamed protein product [Arabidopsis thaliana]
METASFNPSSFLATFPSFLLLFLAVYTIGYFLVFRTWKQSSHLGASCLMSLFHGTPAVIMASHALLTTPRADVHSFASPNTAVESNVLDFSMAYFTVDLLHYLIFLPNDFIFILHHIATLYVFATCRFAVGHGAHGLLLLLILAEATSACQNVWTITGYRKNDVALARRVRELLSPPFYLFYTVVRGLAGPVVLYDMATFYGSGAADGVVPRWAWLSWLVVIGFAILVSCWFHVYFSRMDSPICEKLIRQENKEIQID